MDEVKMDGLKNLIVFEDSIPQEDRDLAEKAGVTLHTLSEVHKIG